MDFDCPTGFGFVAHKVMDMLTPWFKRNDIKVHVVALNYGDKPHRDYNEQISIINAREFARNMDDFYWRDGLLKILQIGDYDLFWAMNDIPVLSPMTMHLAHLNEMKEFNGKKTFKTMLYTPIDSLPYQRYFKNLEKWDKLITYTEYGKNAMVDAFRQVGYTKKLDIGIIPHGLDADNFKPLKNKQELRVKYNLPTDAVIFGNINKNQPRKDLGTTLLAFKRYKNWYEENKSELVGMGLPEKCVLYMHCYHSDKSGVRMHVLLERLNLIAQEDVYFPIDERYEAGKYTSKDMNEIYNCLDGLVNTTTAEGWGLCLHPDSLIETSNGVAMLKDVKIGDKVLTHEGIFKDVIDTTSRVVDEYYSLKTEYSNLETKVTKEHPFLVLNELNNNPEWVNVEDIKIGDYVAIRKPIIRDRNSISIDMFDYVSAFNYNFDETHLWCGFGYSPKNKEWSISSICKKYNTKKHFVESAIKCITNNATSSSETVSELSRKLITDGFVKNEPIKVNRIINITPELMEVFGWYIAEGSNGNGTRVEFDLNFKHFDGKAQFIKNTCESVFGITGVVEKNGENKCRVRFSNSILSEFFGSLFGKHAKNKRIPDFLYQSEMITHLLRGLFLGDGYFKENRNHVSLSTISSNVALQVKSILASYDIMCAVRFSKRQCYSLIICRESLNKFKEALHIEDITFKRDIVLSDGSSQRTHRPNYKFDSEFFYVKVISKDKICEAQEMHDLCIDGSHSFIANGIVCHNTVTEAMSVGLPIVCPVHTSLHEITDDGKLVYAVTDLWEHVQITDAENVRFKSNPEEVYNKMVAATLDMPKKINYLNRYKPKMEQYNWEDIADKFKTEIKKLIL